MILKQNFLRPWHFGGKNLNRWTITLRSLLLCLRRLLPEADAFIHADASHIQWRPASPFTLDVADFERHLAANRSLGHRRGEANNLDNLGGGLGIGRL